ncbi:hypothetical protein FRAHR75_680008 [Frankia sp. Hr75.2]|nr:hypothetical protein FRAHR75_680008 [Frankia sp. Hr75.2]
MRALAWIWHWLRSHFIQTSVLPAMGFAFNGSLSGMTVGACLFLAVAASAAATPLSSELAPEETTSFDEVLRALVPLLEHADSATAAAAKAATATLYPDFTITLLLSTLRYPFGTERHGDRTAHERRCREPLSGLGAARRESGHMSTVGVGTLIVNSACNFWLRHLAYSLGVKGFACRRAKNDVRDAADLADLLRMGRLPEAWATPSPIRELCDTVRHHAALVAIRSVCKAQIHAVLAKNGVVVPMTDLFGLLGPTCSARCGYRVRSTPASRACAGSSTCSTSRSTRPPVSSLAGSREIRATRRCSPFPGPERLSPRCSSPRSETSPASPPLAT